MRKRCAIALVAFVWIFLTVPSIGQTGPDMRREDKIRIREAIRICRLYGDSIWRGVAEVPFVMILVTDSLEFLINHPSPSANFTFVRYDSLLGSNMYARKTVFDKHFQATFPAVGELNTIVIGTPENTGLASAAWVITVLHEHFHQYIYSMPGYYDAVKGLDLAGGDRTGMWMLNYPFPYTDSNVALQYARYTRALSAADSAIGSDSFIQACSNYLAERRRFQSILKPADYRYFSFQVWQEGIARYTEYKFLRALEGYQPSPEYARLPGYRPFSEYRERFSREQMRRIDGWSISEHRRECFYAIGLGEGMILDGLNPHWRERYTSDRFYLERYIPGFK